MHSMFMKSSNHSDSGKIHHLTSPCFPIGSTVSSFILNNSSFHYVICIFNVLPLEYLLLCFQIFVKVGYISVKLLQISSAILRARLRFRRQDRSSVYLLMMHFFSVVGIKLGHMWVFGQKINCRNFGNKSIDLFLSELTLLEQFGSIVEKLAETPDRY